MWTRLHLMTWRAVLLTLALLGKCTLPLSCCFAPRSGFSRVRWLAPDQSSIDPLTWSPARRSSRRARSQ